MNDYTELVKKMMLESAGLKDVDFKHCKICKKYKRRILAGMFDANNRKWVDEDGKLWNGRVCSDCHKEKMMKHMRKRRRKK